MQGKINFSRDAFEHLKKNMTYSRTQKLRARFDFMNSVGKNSYSAHVPLPIGFEPGVSAIIVRNRLHSRIATIYPAAPGQLPMSVCVDGKPIRQGQSRVTYESECHLDPDVMLELEAIIKPYVTTALHLAGGNEEKARELIITWSADNRRLSDEQKKQVFNEMFHALSGKYTHVENVYAHLFSILKGYNNAHYDHPLWSRIGSVDTAVQRLGWVYMSAASVSFTSSMAEEYRRFARQFLTDMVGTNETNERALATTRAISLLSDFYIMAQQAVLYEAFIACSDQPYDSFGYLHINNLTSVRAIPDHQSIREGLEILKTRMVQAANRRA